MRKTWIIQVQELAVGEKYHEIRRAKKTLNQRAKIRKKANK